MARQYGGGSGTEAKARHLTLEQAAVLPAPDVLSALGVSGSGLAEERAAERLAADGPNELPGHRSTGWSVLLRQFANPVLLLLLIAAGLSFATGDQVNALIIGAIMTASTGLGFVNEYRAERTAQDLHRQVSHSVVVVRGGRDRSVDVKDLVVGDLVRVGLGSIVPADLRVVECNELEADEAVLTGESVPVAKSPAPVEPGAALADLGSCLLMGTVVRHGDALAVVVATGADAQFGRIAQGLGERAPRTGFEMGLTRFSMMLLWIGVALMVGILVINLLLRRPFLDALLFSLAIAVGITPQLLPAVVSTSLAAGSRLLAREKVLVKRLTSIEDLGNMDVLVTDKTGTLTEGSITFLEAVPAGQDRADTLRWGLLCCEADPAVGGAGAGQNALDAALWQAAGPGAPGQVDVAGIRRVAYRPFDHDSLTSSVLLDLPDGHRWETLKGAPEVVTSRCSPNEGEGRDALDALFEQGLRVVAVAVRRADGETELASRPPSGFRLAGFLCFLDRPKSDAADALRALAQLGIGVKVTTGDNAVVAIKVCRDLGLTDDAGMVPALTGHQVDALDDEALATVAATTIVFARVSPEQKARIIRLLRARHAVGYLGDGVNDALALHEADVGISVDTGTDVAKDAADVIMLHKDLGTLARGVVGGRRIFANTIKYVLMGTSSNFGNMFSAAAASAFLAFLPMLPQQILLNNVLYDCSQLAIPTDRVDEEQLRKPSHWDLGQIRRFMLVFGPVSSMFDFATFALLLGVLNAGPEEFRTGWFVESLATQTLIVFAIRTRQVPFLRSRPSWALTGAVLTVVAVGVVLPFTAVGALLGFVALPAPFYAALAAMAVLYLALIETVKSVFFRVEAERSAALPQRRRTHPHPAIGVHRRATGFAAQRGAPARVSYGRRRSPDSGGNGPGEAAA
ncbi:magnesium-translocating P-type ATPase [Dietzia sp. UBA5065]|uniref:magnesium-translocating P-type ATPase n=1 Tax=Dietzia sp. UBA5065 TaxID=1946422 RepID=UPI0025C01269|nr:magnesium-translocating P-type ATPase [Dietzia sp. UBA5065]